MAFPPIKIEQARRHSATNGPFGVKITTGTRYFAAVLLQEVFEARRYMAWYWLPLVPFALAGGLYHLAALALIPLWMMIVGRQLVPTVGSREKRELMGQAIEIEVIRVLYEREDMDSEYRLQARSMIRNDSSYKKKGFWPEIAAIDPHQVQWEDDNRSIDAMVALLETQQPAAYKYVLQNLDQLREWRPLGDESHGY